VAVATVFEMPGEEEDGDGRRVPEGIDTQVLPFVGYSTPWLNVAYINNWNIVKNKQKKQQTIQKS
jgi:hypothetical protein